MRSNKKIIWVFLLICCQILLGAPQKPNINILNPMGNKSSADPYGVSEEVEIDFEKDTASAPEGINFDYQGMKIKAFKSRRDTKRNKIYLDGDFISEIAQPFGMLKIEGKDGEISAKGDEGTFKDAFGYIEVGNITGAEHPNENVYFGGKKIEYKDGKITLNKGWISTDFNVRNSGNPNAAGYHFLSDKILIEPDKQITLINSDFYKRSKDMMPFTFPWYRANIRSGSKVPLFPEITSDTYYGFESTWGVLYGDQNSKYKGGISPKYADTMGLLIGRWENWYKTDNIGTAKINIDDYLLTTKVEKKRKYENPIEYEQKHKRFGFNISHEYDGQYGKFLFDSYYGTLSMIPKLNDLINTYDSRGWFSNAYDAIPTKRPKFDDTIGFYTLDSELKGMGPKKDIYFKSAVKMTDDKKAYALMVYDAIDDIGYGGRVDNDLYSQFELYKDNKSYKVGGYYNYLYDMDPGSTFNDTQARAEDFGFEFHEKKHNIGFSYDEKNDDKYRALGLWERDPNMNSTVTVRSQLGTRFNYLYNPTMVREYVQNNSKDLRVSFGEYKISDDTIFKAGFDTKEFLKELDTGYDNLRSGVIYNNDRDKQYNRYEDIIYHDFKEHKAYVSVYNDEIKVTLSGGKTKDNFLTREGLYDGSYKKYVNESDFYQALLEKDKIDLGKLGSGAISLDLRYDSYDKGMNPLTRTYSTGKDSTLRTIINIDHIKELINNKDDDMRTWDVSLTNEIKGTYQKYSYDEGNIKFGNTTKDSGRVAKAKEIRLQGKEDFFMIADTAELELGNTQTTYNITYKEATDPAITNHTAGKILNNSIDMKIDGVSKVGGYYNTDKRYTDERMDDKNYNNLTYDSYGGHYNFGQHSISYGRYNVTSDVIKMKNTDDSHEKIVRDTYGYSYKFKNNDTIALNYSNATDKRDNLTRKIKEQDVENENYFVSYLDSGSIERQYTLSYGTYKHKEPGSKGLVLDGKRYNSRNSDELYFGFDWRDKRLTKKDLEEYGQIEYNKDPGELSPEELEKIKNILQNRSNNRNIMNFDLLRIRDEEYKLRDYKRNFRVWIRGEKNKARYEKTGDYLKSLQEISGGVFYSYKRTGIGYTFDVNNGWQGTKWKKIDREHKISLHSKIGKPSKGWEVKTYAKFYENLNDKISNKNKKNSLDGLGVEIGKEFDYYQWSVACEKTYTSSGRDYEWKVGIQFKLLTFPAKPILGIGSKHKAGKTAGPDISIFDGIKPEKIVED